jgi:SsrA-binding protein
MAKPARSARHPKPGEAVKPIVENRKARFQYELLERLEAGIVLTGSEVKSLRESKINLGDGYCRVDRDGQIYLVDVHISPYPHAGYAQHQPLRPRKLLLHQREILRLHQRVREKGLTLVPVRLYFRKGRVKVEIALAKGKTLYDRRETIKKRDTKREARLGR